MRIKKKCRVCDTPFVAIKTNQYFCSRKCFKKDYNARKREERRVDRETNPARFGYYNCTFCGEKTILPFSPKRYKAQFETYKCPVCETPRFKDPSNMRDDWPWDTEHWSQGWKKGENFIQTTVTTVTVITVTTRYG